MMKRHSTNEGIVNNFNSLLIRIGSYLMAFVVALRGYVLYSEVSRELLLIFIPLVLLYLLEGVMLLRPWWMQILYIVSQVFVMCLLYSYAPYADYWALILLPACVFSMQVFKQWQGYALVAFMTIVAGIMLIWAEGTDAIYEYIPVYFASYILTSTLSLAVKQAYNAHRESQKLLEQLEMANSRLRSYADQSADYAIMEERTIIARDLHDSVTQTLFSANLLIGSLEHQYELKEPGLEQDISNISNLTDSAIKELRGLINQLKTGHSGNVNFYEELSLLRDEFQRRFQFEIGIHHNGAFIAGHARRPLLRIIREAVHNCLKHSNVNSSIVSITETEIGLKVSISDKGQGMDPEKIPREHYGISNMKERTLELGGTFTIQSRPEKGTEIILQIPRYHKEEPAV